MGVIELGSAAEGARLISAPLEQGENGKFCLSEDGRILPLVIDGDKKSCISQRFQMVQRE